MNNIGSIVIGFIGIAFAILGQFIIFLIPAGIAKLLGAEFDTVRTIAFWGVVIYLVLALLKTSISLFDSFKNPQSPYGQRVAIFGSIVSYIFIALVIFYLVYYFPH